MKEQKQTQYNPKVLTKQPKPRRAHADALKMRPYTEGVQTAHQILGPPALDPKFPQAKVAQLLKELGLA